MSTSKKTVISIEVIERKKNGVEIREVTLAPSVTHQLSTGGADLQLPPNVSERRSRTETT